MGSLDQVNQLEVYIEELGHEITKVKKVSEYLFLIEKMHSEITRTSATLLQSKDQIKLYQEILESKLELYHTIAKNIEVKQSMLEQTQVNIIDKISELSKHFEAIDVSLKNSNMEIKDEIKQAQHQINQNHDKLVHDLRDISNQQNNQNSTLLSSIKFNKLSLGINAGLMVIVILLVLLFK